MSSTFLFEREIAKMYYLFRPIYPDSIYRTIFQYCEQRETNDGPFDFGQAVDVGCGNGQSTIQLCAKFRKVIGCDLSSDQIKYAKRHTYKNLSFVVSPAEKLNFLQPNSVDLITVATALHWMNHDTFFKEVFRVLKPGGVIGVYGYTYPTLDIPSANNEYLKFFLTTLKYYWNPCTYVDFGFYKDVSLPDPGYKRIPEGTLHMMCEYTVEDFVGFIRSCDGWQTYKDQHPGCLDLVNLTKQLKQSYGNRKLKTVWPMFMLLGRKTPEWKI